jgi:hypothetical protein
MLVLDDCCKKPYPAEYIRGWANLTLRFDISPDKIPELWDCFPSLGWLIGPDRPQAPAGPIVRPYRCILALRNRTLMGQRLTGLKLCLWLDGTPDGAWDVLTIGATVHGEGEGK